MTNIFMKLIHSMLNRFERYIFFFFSMNSNHFRICYHIRLLFSEIDFSIFDRKTECLDQRNINLIWNINFCFSMNYKLMVIVAMQLCENKMNATIKNWVFLSEMWRIQWQKSTCKNNKIVFFLWPWTKLNRCNCCPMKYAWIQDFYFSTFTFSTSSSSMQPNSIHF